MLFRQPLPPTGLGGPKRTGNNTRNLGLTGVRQGWHWERNRLPARAAADLRADRSPARRGAPQPTDGGSAGIWSLLCSSGLATSPHLDASGLGTQWSLLQGMPKTSRTPPATCSLLLGTGLEQGWRARSRCSANMQREADITGSRPGPCAPNRSRRPCDAYWAQRDWSS